MKIKPLVVFDDGEPAGGDPPAPAPTPDPPPAPAPQANPTPWQSALEEQFGDEGIRSEVDQFLRSTVQPYVTDLEQKSVSNRDANKLWGDFKDQPVHTFTQVTRELFGDEMAEEVVNVLMGEHEPKPSAAQEDDVNDDDLFDESIKLDQLPPEVREAVAYGQQQRRQDEYFAELERVKGENEDLKIQDELLHPFVVAAQGDFDVAIAGYKEFISKAAETFGTPEIPETLEVKDPPPVVGSDSTAPTTPPMEKTYESFDDAIDDFFAELKNPPPVVGAT